MKPGDLVAWVPTRGVFGSQEVKFVGVVTGGPVEYRTFDGKLRVPVIWTESTMPTLTDIRDIKVIEATNESR